MTARILIDCDGVLCAFLPGLLAAINAETGATHKPETCNKWEIWEAYGFPREQMDQICMRKGFCADLPPFPGAVEAVRQLRTIMPVWVLTVPYRDEHHRMSDHWMPERLAWLQKHFGFRTDEICFCSSKIKPAIDGSIIVDDRVDTVVDWLHEHSRRGGRGVVWEAPYNRDAKLPDRKRCIQRTSSWDDVIALARQVAERQAA